MLSTPKCCPGKNLPIGVKNLPIGVRIFYRSGAVSRVMPGKKDCFLLSFCVS